MKPLSQQSYIRKNPNTPIHICKQFGFIWKGFKVSKGALYGVVCHTPYVVTNLPDLKSSTVSLWVLERSGEWKRKKISMNSSSLEIFDRLVASEISTTLATILKKNPTHKIEGFRDPFSKKSIQKAHILPSQRITQNMSMSGKARHQKPLDGHVNSHGFTDFEANAKPVIFPECYWATGKNTPQVSHKKPKPDKVTRK